MKAILAFLAGAVVAGGVAFVALRKDHNPDTALAQNAVPAAEAVAPTPAPEAAPTPSPTPEPTPVPSAVVKSTPKRTATVSSRRTPSAPEPSEPAPSSPPVQPPAPTPAPVVEQPAQPVTPVIAPTPVPTPPPPHKVTISAGTLLTIRLNEALASDHQQPGDAFTATLDQPLIVDGFVIAERGSRVEGKVVESRQAGRVKGVAHLAVELTRLHTADRQNIPIETETFEKEGETSKKEDAAKVGAGAAIGAVIGAIAGGGKGAAIGAGVGGGAGAGTVIATRGKPARLPVETRISFKLRAPVTVTEQR